MALLAFALAGCGPRVTLKWGEVVYESVGNQNIKDLEVTRDGDKLTVKVKTAENSETQAALSAIELAKEAMKFVPAK